MASAPFAFHKAYDRLRGLVRRRFGAVTYQVALFVAFGSFCTGPKQAALAFANWRLPDQELPEGPAWWRLQVQPDARGEQPSLRPVLAAAKRRSIGPRP